ncbi:MAG: HEAT repeat domain-containing protein [Acidobacteria bacterium]|nr:HEAT repeat domain-containing protein [Acidobacteriota bacterium]
MNCDETQSRIPLFLYGELSFDEEESFEAHMEACAGCREEVARQTILHRTLGRRDFAVQVRTGPHQARTPSAITGRLAGLWNHLALPRLVWQPAAALALVSLGFFSSRLMTPGGYLMANSEPVSSRVKYLEPEGSGKVHLVVEETRQRVLNGRLDDAPIRRLLLAAAKDPSDPGIRVESIDVLSSSSNAREVRRALLNALLHDSNAGVRLKAIEGLKPYANEPETRRILAQVLLNDDNPGLRTQAVDLLMQHRESDVVGILQQLLQKEDNGYIRMRSQKALRDMNASEGTF